jgi:hypothetical protein
MGGIHEKDRIKHFSRREIHAVSEEVKIEKFMVKIFIK